MSAPPGMLLTAVRRCVDYPLCPALLCVWLCLKEQTSLLSVTSIAFELARFSGVQRVWYLCSLRCGGCGNHAIASFEEISTFPDFCHRIGNNSSYIVCTLYTRLISDVECIVEIINVIFCSLVVSVL
jgi:hypothetical protein